MVYFNAKESTLEVIGKDALPVEYKRANWHLLRQADVNDFIGKASIKCFISSDASHVEKQGVQIIGRQVGVPDHNISN